MYWKPHIKYILLSILLLLSSPASCGFFSAIGECVSDPCNCGRDEKKRTEYWGYTDDGSLAGHTRNTDKNCPPYDKLDNRVGCLKRFDTPGKFEVYYNEFCAEHSPVSNYYQPQVRVRIQTCNVACWTHSKTLNWDGQCVSYEGPLGIPLTRLCARVALPANGEKGSPEYRSADPGYSKYKYARGKGYAKTYRDRSINENDTYFMMDSTGWEVEIPSFIDADGNPFQQKMPKICVYEDFTVLDIIRGKFDLIDIMPNSQAMHYNPGTHPVVKVITSIIRFASQMKKMLPNLLLKVLSFIPGLDFLAPVLDFIFYLINWQAELLAWVLENVGRINNSVGDYPIGCVELPLGPYPPPFPKTLQDFPQAPTLNNICAYNDKPSKAKPCVPSNVKNNYINNAVRIGYDNLVPLCDNLDEEDLELEDGESPRCAMLDGGLTTASILHQSLQNDVIPACDQEGVNGLCADFLRRKHFCDITYDSGDQPYNFNCKAGYRLVYGLKRGTNITKQLYYDEAIPECKQDSEDACQMIWGINIGPFMDVSLKFPEREYFYMTGEIRKNVSMYATPFNQSTDPSAQIQDTRRKGRFDISVSRQTMEDSETGYTQESQEICAYDKTFPGLTRVVGCVARPKPPLPMKIQNCADSDAKLTCRSTMFDPKMIVGFEAEGGDVGTIDETYGILGIQHISPSGVDDSAAVINLAGYDVKAVATDDDFRVMPFTGSDALSQSIITGNYKDNKLPFYVYRDTVVPRSGAVYLNGLAYNNQVYYGGGTKVCISKVPELSCTPESEENCVLSGLSYSDYTNCDNFNNVLRQNYPGLRMCVLEERSDACDNVEEIAGKQPLIIRRCNDTEYCYAYKNDQTFAKLHPSISGLPNPEPPTDADKEEAEALFSRPVCTVDLTLEGRIDPAPNAGAVLPRDVHYEFEKSEPVTKLEKYQVQLDYFNTLQEVFNIFQQAVEQQQQADEAHAEVQNKYSAERDAAIANADRLNQDAQSSWSLARNVPDDSDEAWQTYLAQKAEAAEEGSLAVVNAPYPQKAVEVAKAAADQIKSQYQNSLSGSYRTFHAELGDVYEAQKLIVDQPTLEHASSLLNIAIADKAAFAEEYNQQLGMANNGSNIDSALAATRAKTVVEQGLCTSIPQPSCRAVGNQGSSTGFVGWESAQYGELSHATSQCPAGKHPRDDEGLQRYCLYDQVSGTVAFESIAENYKGCSEAWSCFSEDNEGEATGFVAWPAAEMGRESVVKECPLGYDPKKEARGEPLKRLCRFDAALGKAKLESADGKGCEFAPRPCYVISSEINRVERWRYYAKTWIRDAYDNKEETYEPDGKSKTLDLKTRQKMYHTSQNYQNFAGFTQGSKSGSGKYQYVFQTPVYGFFDGWGAYHSHINLNIGDSTTIKSMYFSQVRYKDALMITMNGHNVFSYPSNGFSNNVQDEINDTDDDVVLKDRFEASGTTGVIKKRGTGSQKIDFLNIEGNNDLFAKLGIASDGPGSDGILALVLNFELDCDDYDRSQYDSYKDAYLANDTGVPSKKAAAAAAAAAEADSNAAASTNDSALDQQTSSPSGTLGF